MRALVQRMAADPTVRPRDVAASVAWSPRTLQLEQHPDTDLTDLAVRLGWYDQPHLTEDFRRVLGTTPGRYAAGSARS